MHSARDRSTHQLVRCANKTAVKFNSRFAVYTLYTSSGTHMATCGSTSSSSSDSNFSNSSGEDQPQPLLLSWAYLTPPELEIATDHLFSTRATVAPPRARRRIKEEHFTKKEEKNAKERDRVKRLNTLYINLRSVLGGECRESKLSKVPVLHAAICYIRSLDKELQELEQKHQQLKMSPDQQTCDGPRAVLSSLQQPTITPEQSKAQVCQRLK